MLCPEARIYDHGPQHPLRPQRVLLTWDLIHATGLDELPNVERLRSSTQADDATIELVHTAAFVDATRGRATARTAIGPASVTGRATTRSST